MPPDTRRTDPDQPVGTPLSRRGLMRGAATVCVVGVAGATLAACGGSSGAADSSSGGGGGGGGSSSSADPKSPGGSGGGTTVPTSEVPVGGGEIVKVGGKPVVVAQPKKGDFTAFSAICTHMGCTVNPPKGGTITCPCHGSQYSAEDGSVQGGPAPSPLPKVKAAVSGGTITLA